MNSNSKPQNDFQVALDSIVKEHNQGDPDFFVSRIIFKSEYVDVIEKKQKTARV